MFSVHNVVVSYDREKDVAVLDFETDINVG